MNRGGVNNRSLHEVRRSLTKFPKTRDFEDTKSCRRFNNTCCHGVKDNKRILSQRKNKHRELPTSQLFLNQSTSCTGNLPISQNSQPLDTSRREILLPAAPNPYPNPKCAKRQQRPSPSAPAASHQLKAVLDALRLDTNTASTTSARKKRKRAFAWDWVLVLRRL